MLLARKRWKVGGKGDSVVAERMMIWAVRAAYSIGMGIVKLLGAEFIPGTIG